MERPSKSLQTSRLCVVLDTEIMAQNEEVFVVDRSIIYHYPNNLTKDSIKKLVGNMNGLHNLITSLSRRSIPRIITTKKYKISCRQLGKYFILMTSQPVVPTVSHFEDFELLIEAMVFYLGPHPSLSLIYGEDELRDVMGTVMNHIFSSVVNVQTNAVFRNHLACLPLKRSTHLECQVRCCNVINELGVIGGAVINRGKILYSNLSNRVLLFLYGLSEQDVPIEPVPNPENVVIVRVYGDKKYFCDAGKSVGQEGEPEEMSEAMAENLIEEMEDKGKEEQGGSEGNGSVDESDDNFEFVPLDLPSSEPPPLSSSSRVSQMFTRRHSQYSRFSELFERQGSSPLSRSGRSFSIDEQLFEESISSTVSVQSEQQGNSLAYKLLKSEEGVSSEYGGSRRNGSVLTEHEETPIPLPGDTRDPLSCFHSLCEKMSGEEERELDSLSQDSEYHDALPPGPSLDPPSPLLDLEVMVLNRSDSKILLVGEELCEKAGDLRAASVQLLGEINATFCTEVKTEMKRKFTTDVYSYVHNRDIWTVNQNHCSRGLPGVGVTRQMMFCRDMLEEEDEGEGGHVTMLVVKGVTWSTVLTRKHSGDLYIASRPLRPDKLVDKATEIGIRNFGSLLL